MREEYIKSVREDILHIQKILKMEKSPSRITLIVHAPYKQKVRELVAMHKNMPKIMEEAKKDEELAARMQDVSKLAQKYIKSINKLVGSTLGDGMELSVHEDAKEFLSSEFGGAEIEVIKEEDATQDLEQKAANAQPNKPSIVLE
jgi:hypothetical protein